MPAPCILSSLNARNTYLTGPLRSGARRGRGRIPEVCFRHLSCRVDLEFLNTCTRRDSGLKCKFPGLWRALLNQHSRYGVQRCVASLASKVMGQVEFANHVPISPGGMFSPTTVTACPYAIYLVNTQRLLILHSKGSFGNYYGKQARMPKLCFTCILCFFSWLL